MCHVSRASLHLELCVNRSTRIGVAATRLSVALLAGIAAGLGVFVRGADATEMIPAGR